MRRLDSAAEGDGDARIPPRPAHHRDRRRRCWSRCCAPRAAARGRLDGELAIYRDQLAELERERAAGTLPEGEAAAARTEIERRILAAAERPTAAAPRRPARAAPVPAAGARAGDPAAGARPLSADRPSRPAGGALRRRARPAAPPTSRSIPRAWSPPPARASAAAPDDPDAQSALGEALTLEADGTVTPPALEAFTRRSAGRPDDARALYYLGLHEAQSGDCEGRARALAGAGGQQPARCALPAHAAGRDRARRQGGGHRAAPMPPHRRRPGRSRPCATSRPSSASRRSAAWSRAWRARLKDNPQDRAGWLRLANAWKVLGENEKAADAYGHADALAPVDARLLADWAEAQVRQIKPGAAAAAPAVAVLSGWRRPSRATRWRCSISAPPPSPPATRRPPRSAGRRCWPCCRPTRPSARCWSSASRKPKRSDARAGRYSGSPASTRCSPNRRRWLGSLKAWPSAKARTRNFGLSRSSMRPTCARLLELAAGRQARGEEAQVADEARVGRHRAAPPVDRVGPVAGGVARHADQPVAEEHVGVVGR